MAQITKSRKQGLILFSIFWGAALTLGFVFLTQYSSTAGALGEAKSEWPARALLEFEPGRPNMVVFLHPRCACSRASVAELESLLLRANKEIKLTVVFFRPESQPENWSHSGLWDRVEKLPRAKLVSDPGGYIAGQFGALTSGTTLLFAPGGKLLFHGGITASRGHVGESSGQREILSQLTESPKISAANSMAQAPVFGCSL